MLSAKQKKVALEKQKAVQNGDSKASAFFDKIRTESPALWKEYEEYLGGSREGQSNLKRKEFKCDTTPLSQKQFTIAVAMAAKHADGVGEAISFFEQQESLAQKGSRTAKAYLDICKEFSERGDKERQEVLDSVKVVKPATHTEQTTPRVQNADELGESNAPMPKVNTPNG